MTKKLVLINKNEHGFGLSVEAHILYLKKAKLTFHAYRDNFKKTLLLKCDPRTYALSPSKHNLLYHSSEIPRDHPALMDVFNELGLDGMNDAFSELHFAEVDVNSEWSIKLINGKEYISIRTS